MAAKPYLMVSLEDGESKALAQVLSNDTSRGLMKFLATKENATESEIAKALKLPLSTVHYNIQNLVKAKLVEAQEFHYSEKGKEVLHYSLSNKLIVIAPSKSGHSKLLKKVLPAAGAVGIGAAALHFFGSALSGAPASEPRSLMMEAAPMIAADAPAAVPFYLGLPFWFAAGGLVGLAAYALAVLVLRRRH